jgi:hypothetical protein
MPHLEAKVCAHVYYNLQLTDKSMNGLRNTELDYKLTPNHQMINNMQLSLLTPPSYAEAMSHRQSA